MADKSGHTLSDYFLPLRLSGQTQKKADEYFNSPEGMANRQNMAELRAEEALRQTPKCALASVEVEREENAVTITWELFGRKENAEKFYVLGLAWEIGFRPDPNDFLEGLIVETYGNGSKRLELEEGRSYLFEFSFSQTGNDVLALTSFVVAIPLSDERKALLRKAVKLNSQPEEAIRHEVTSFLSKRAVREEELQKGIAQIKAKKLSSEDEQEEIKDFIDHVKVLSSKYKI